MNEVSDIILAVKPAFDMLERTVKIMDKLARWYFIPRWIARQEKRADGNSANSGDNGTAANSGDNGTAANSGWKGTAANSGWKGTAANSGSYGTAANSGSYGTAANSGDNGTAANSGWKGTAVNTGYRGAVAGKLGTLLLCGEYRKDDCGNPKPVGGFALMVDGKRIKENTFYVCQDGKPIEVDLTDGVFSWVKSTRKVGDLIVKKIIIEDESHESYVVIAGDKAAHGATLADAKKDLLYKISNRDTSPYKSWNLDDVKTAAELIEAYRVITGACFAGTKHFCESINIPKKATVREAIEKTRGQYGAKKFAQFFENKGN